MLLNTAVVRQAHETENKSMNYGLNVFCVCMHCGTAGQGPDSDLVWGVPGQKGSCCAPCALVG